MFFATALTVAALVDRERKKTAWWATASGVIALGWPMFFWVQHLVEAYHSSGAWLRNVLALRYFHLLLSNLSGVILSYSLGSHFEKFIAHPIVFLAHVGLIGLTLFAVYQFFRRHRLKLPSFNPELKTLLIYGVLSTGALMTFAGVYGERHYYLGLFPLPYIAFAAYLRTKKSHWPAFAVASLQLVVSIAFLVFIHFNGGAPGADFGALPPR